ncbi:MAG TPA: helix-turn-helix domain-containing protein [Acidobacteriaceae bacterium]|nr:helix-turn-helix domain-containing protein [Acidobacteriaceae bacterium]
MPNIQTEEPDSLTPEQVAEKLQMNASVVRRMLAEGKLPGRRVGRIWRVSARALRDFIEGSSPASATMTKEAETPSQRFERQIREGCVKVLEAATHPAKFNQVEPLSPERLLSISEWDRRLLGVCADALAVCRTQKYTPVEDMIDSILTAYSHGEMGDYWKEIMEQHSKSVQDHIEGARLMLRQFPAEVLGSL